MKFLRLTDLPLAGKRVFIRADLNVPLASGAVADDSRIRASQETLAFVRERGGRVVLASHLGRPKGGVPEAKYSLAPVARHMGLELAPDCVGPDVEARVAKLRDGDAILLENLRFHAGEEKNDPAFVAQLAKLCDVYVNDAFGTAHRAHASTDGLARACRVRAMGFLLAREIEALTRVRDEPQHPYLCILGGAKVSDMHCNFLINDAQASGDADRVNAHYGQGFRHFLAECRIFLLNAECLILFLYMFLHQLICLAQLVYFPDAFLADERQGFPRAVRIFYLQGRLLAVDLFVTKLDRFLRGIKKRVPLQDLVKRHVLRRSLALVHLDRRVRK